MSQRSRPDPTNRNRPRRAAPMASRAASNTTSTPDSMPFTMALTTNGLADTATRASATMAVHQPAARSPSSDRLARTRPQSPMARPAVRATSASAPP